MKSTAQSAICPDTGYTSHILVIYITITSAERSKYIYIHGYSLFTGVNPELKKQEGWALRWGFEHPIHMTSAVFLNIARKMHIVCHRDVNCNRNSHTNVNETKVEAKNIC